MNAEWYKWYPSIYRADTMHLTAEQDGIYRRLIDHYMETRQPLPDNDAALSRIAGVSFDSWAIAAAIVRPYFLPCDGHRLRHKMCDSVLAEQDAKAMKQSLKGKAGAKKRWDSCIEIKEENSSGHANAIAEPMPSDSRGEERRREENKEIPTIVGKKKIPIEEVELSHVADWAAAHIPKHYFNITVKSCTAQLT